LEQAGQEEERVGGKKRGKRCPGTQSKEGRGNPKTGKSLGLRRGKRK